MTDDGNYRTVSDSFVGVRGYLGGSHLPAAAVASSKTSYWIWILPSQAFELVSARACWMPLTIV